MAIVYTDCRLCDRSHHVMGRILSETTDWHRRGEVALIEWNDVSTLKVPYYAFFFLTIIGVSTD